MATPYSDVFDQFYMFLKDYRLKILMDSSIENFENYLIGWLKPAIVEFTRNHCVQDLSQRDDTARTFNIDLTDETLVILARLMVRYWFEKEVHDVEQFRLVVQDRDFKRVSENMALQSKQATLDKIKEDIYQDLTVYGYNHLDWSKWYAGNFM